MSRDLALYTSKNDNFLFQNQQWLSWQLQPTQPFPSDAGSFSSLTYNIYHILHHIAAFIVSSSFHTSRAFFHFHFLSKFTSLASFPLSLSFQIHQPRIFQFHSQFLPNSSHTRSLHLYTPRTERRKPGSKWSAQFMKQFIPNTRILMLLGRLFYLPGYLI